APVVDRPRGGVDAVWQIHLVRFGGDDRVAVEEGHDLRLRQLFAPRRGEDLVADGVVREGGVQPFGDVRDAERRQVPPRGAADRGAAARLECEDRIVRKTAAV